MINKIFDIFVEDIYEECLESFIEFSQIKIDTVTGKKLLNKAKEARELFCKDCFVKVIISPFPSNSVQREFFIIEDRVIECNELKMIDLSKVIGGYMYAVFINNYSYANMTTLQMFYVDCWLNAYVEAGWNKIKSFIIKDVYQDFMIEEYKRDIVISKSYAPGFEGISMDSTKDIFELMNLKLYEMELQDNNMILPSKNITGIYIVSS